MWVSEKIDFRTKISIVGHPLLATGRRIGHDRQSVLQTPSWIVFVWSESLHTGRDSEERERELLGEICSRVPIICVALFMSFLFLLHV